MSRDYDYDYDYDYGHDSDDWYEDDDTVVGGIPQAVIKSGEHEGKPLPTYNTDTKSTVKLNYYDLPYKIITRNKTFSDIKNHAYEEEILEAANRMIIEGGDIDAQFDKMVDDMYSKYNMAEQEKLAQQYYEEYIK